MVNTTKTSRQDTWQGMNWCRPATRLAIYLRDGMVCCYCGATVEDGVSLSLDHVKPHSKGGSNRPSNLITCCKRCNSARGDRPVAVFARAVADYLDHDADPEAIVKHIRRCRDRKLPREEARELMARRGGLAAVMSNE